MIVERIEIMRFKKMTCIAFGSFESVHRGHLKIAQTVVEAAKERGLTSVIISVPREGKVFTTEEEKEYLFKKEGIDVFISTTEAELAKVIEKLGAKVVVVGEHHRETVQDNQDSEVIVVEKEDVSLADVQSAYVNNDYEKMTELCGHPYIMISEVVHGKALGRTHGMPTANLKVPNNKVKPQDAVYGTSVLLGDEVFHSVTNIGKRPSVDDFDYVTIEAFILDFNRDIYGQKVLLEVHKHVREVKKFNNLAEVREQIDKDIDEVNRFLECRKN